nr:hypothetical protein [uncultured Halomonas sp.]
MLNYKKFKDFLKTIRKPLFSISEFVSAKRLQKRLLHPEDLDSFIVDPRLITSCIRRGAKKRFFISAGDWDINDVGLISELRPVIFSTVHAMFTHGVHYKNTEQYVEMIKTINSSPAGEVRTSPSFGAYWCKSQEDIDEYFRKLIRAYESIKRDGYRSQAQIAEDRPEDSRNLSDEILVFIGRNGDLILGNGGTHRVIMAQSLGLEKVHVRISGIHEGFLGDIPGWKGSVRNELATKVVAMGFMYPAGIIGKSH